MSDPVVRARNAFISPSEKLLVNWALDEAREVLAERAADYFVASGIIKTPEERREYVEHYEGRESALASTAVLIALLRQGGAR